jgi:hypothetical protein
VEVRFDADGDGGTTVAVEHRGFDRHGDGAEYAQMLDSPQGWPYILERFAAGSASRGGP